VIPLCFILLCGFLSQLALAQAGANETSAVAPAISAENLRGFQNASGLPGDDAGSKIQQAIRALPPGGGVVDARGFSGRVAIKENLAADIPPGKAVTILLGTATFVLAPHGAQQVFAANRISVIGSGIANTVVQFTNPSEDIFVVPNSLTLGSQIALTNMTIEPAPGVTRTGGNIVRYGGNNGMFQNLRLIDAWQGFFIQNALQTTFDNIEFLTTRAGTLNYGLFLYGYDVDDFFRHIYGDSKYPISDAFIHTRNWVTGMHYTDIEWEGTKGIGLRFDCGSSPTAAGGKCTNAPNARPEITRIDQAFVESGPTEPALLIQGAQDVRFSNSYFASSSSVRIEGESTAVSIDNSFIGNMTNQCVVIDTSSAGGPGKSGVSITNSEINLCSQTTGTAPAITLERGVSNVSIQANRIGNNTYPQLTSHEAPWGVQLVGENNNIRIIGNDFTSQIGGKRVLVRPILQQGKPGTDNVIFGNIPSDGGALTQDHVLRFAGSIVTTGSDSDSLKIDGLTESSHCQQNPANAQAATMAVTPPGVYVDTSQGRLTLHHPKAAGAAFSVFCSFE
jgi:hypothetical protein